MGIKVGILGLAGSGKDTFATMLQKHLPDFAIDRYAAPLKALTAEVYNCTLEELEDRAFKEKPKQVSRDVMIESVFYCLTNVLNFTEEELDKASELFFEHFGSAKALSPREFQQVFGTDVVRAVKPNAWVQHLQGKGDNLIVPDVRFDNELCDYNILITGRIGINKPKPTHSSELYAWRLEHDWSLELPPENFDVVENVFIEGLEPLRVKALEQALIIQKL